MSFELTYTFDDLNLVPVFSSIKSRKQPDTTTQVGKTELRTPIIAAPMSTVVEHQMASSAGSVGAGAVVHRYMSIPEQVKQAREVGGRNYLGCTWFAVGASGDYLERAAELMKVGVRKFCVDVANGHSKHCISAVAKIRKEMGEEVDIMAGNVCTGEGFRRLEEAGADSIRVGIGPGSACTTRLTTGFGVPQLTAIKWCVEASLNASVIADGGIRGSGDVVKALAMGADAVMIGGMLAGTDESPGETLRDDEGRLYKFYHGMACYSSDTEILTLDGWKCVKEVGESDMFATLNPDSKELEYQPPSKVFEYEYDGKMIEASTKFINFLVTPNHKIYCKARRSKEGFNLVAAENIFGKEKTMETKCFWSGSKEDFFFVSKDKRRHFKDFKVEMSEWLDFFGFWLAEGSCGKNKNYSISISNNKKEIIDHYSKLISSWNISPFVRKRGKNYELTFSHATLCCYLRQFGKAHEKYIPVEFKKLNTFLLKILLNGIALGGGCSTRNSIYTNSVKLRDDIWEIAFKCGMSPSININDEKGALASINGKNFTKRHTVWEVSRLNYKIKSHTVYKKNWSVVDYKGKVYCVEVPNHIVCVKRKNKHVWCGNSIEARKDFFSKSDTSFVPEGVSTKVWHKGSAVKILESLNNSLKVGMSFADAKTLKELQENAEWVRVTDNGRKESNPNMKLHK